MAQIDDRLPLRLQCPLASVSESHLASLLLRLQCHSRVLCTSAAATAVCNSDAATSRRLNRSTTGAGAQSLQELMWTTSPRRTCCPVKRLLSLRVGLEAARGRTPRWLASAPPHPSPTVMNRRQRRPTRNLTWQARLKRVVSPPQANPTLPETPKLACDGQTWWPRSSAEK